MDENIQISSDSEEEIPFAERVGRKVYGKDWSNASSSARFTSILSKPDSSGHRSPSPTRKVSGLNVQITPPPPSPEVSPAPSRSTSSLTSSRSSGSSLLVPSSSTVNVTNKSKKQKVSREEKEIERQRKKQEKELEKENNKAIKDAEKIVAKQTDKDQVNKYMEVIIDPEAVSCPPGSEILSALQKPPTEKAEHIFTFRVEKLPVPRSLTWRRKILLDFSLNNGRAQFQESWQEEGRVMILISTLDIVDKIEHKTIESWARDAKRKCGGKHLSLMIYGFKEYFKEEKNAAERVRKAQIRGERPAKKDLERMAATVSKYYCEEALVNLSLESLADYYTFDKTPSKGMTD